MTDKYLVKHDLMHWFINWESYLPQELGKQSLNFNTGIAMIDFSTTLSSTFLCCQDTVGVNIIFKEIGFLNRECLCTLPVILNDT